MTEDHLRGQDRAPLQPRGCRHTHRYLHRLTAAACSLLACLGLFGSLSAPAEASQSDRGTAVARTAKATGAAPGLPALADKAQTDGSQEGEADISLESSTPVVTATSGYSFKVKITNKGRETLSGGNLLASTNALYSFSSRTDMQTWAEGGARIPTPDVFTRQEVGDIAPDQSKEISADLPSDNPGIHAMVAWGPKPVRFAYVDGEGKTKANIYTFLTRTRDGLQTADTPALSVTMVMPVTTADWTATKDSIKALVNDRGKDEPETGGGKQSSANQGGSKNDEAESSSDRQTSTPTPSPSGNSQGEGQAGQGDGGERKTTAFLTLTPAGANRGRKQEDLLAKHPALQSIMDPTYLHTFTGMPRVNGLMQPADFDITTYAENEPSSYRDAGVDPQAWRAASVGDQYRQTAGKSADDPGAYAWQGRAEWTRTSMAEAKRQGYDTVIAPEGFEAGAGASAHTGKYTVTTSAGEVTVLSAQRELSRLAQGHPTSSLAGGEATGAGRTARFLAQSAFYQMEQPYADRDLMVCFGAGENPALVDQIMSAAEEATWLSLGDLATLNKATPQNDSGQYFQSVLEPGEKEGGSGGQEMIPTLHSLATSRKDIDRFGTSILVEGETATPEPSQTRAKADTQALARQDASSTAHRPTNPQPWLNDINRAHDLVALHSLSGVESAPPLADQARALSDHLLEAIRINPTESITVVSETATMPVTVSNSLPFPVRAKVSSKTNSTEIVTARTADTVIPAHSEVQVTFTIRVATAGQADADISLIDRDGNAFGRSGNTHITSNLRLSDMSGLVIVVVAVLLGLLGLWRQFHRTKDPDE